MRPQKIRLIAAEPRCRRFFPETAADAPAMPLGLDMLEALRLADAEGLPHEEAARRMEISPPTFCRLLAEARRRVARALTQGLTLVMEGGPVRVRRGGHGHGCGGEDPAGPEVTVTAGHHGSGSPCGARGGHNRGHGRGHGHGHGGGRRLSA